MRVRSFFVVMLAAMSAVGVAGGTDIGRVPPVVCLERAGTNGFHVASGHSAIAFDIRSLEGSRYVGWTLKRVRMTLDDGAELTTGFPSVTVDLLEGVRLSDKVASVPAEVFPVALDGRKAVCDLYLRDAGGKTLKLSKGLSLGRGETAWRRINIDLPQASGGGWTETPHTLDVEEYRRKALNLIRRADVPSLQVTMTTPLDTLSFCVVNEGFYAAPGRQQEVRPIDMASMYQACSISKPPLAYFAVKMAQDGLLDLDRPLFEYAPGILGHFEADKDRERAKRVTARMILTHTSGLPNKGYVKMSFLDEPGRRFIYSGVGIFVLQEVIERLKGKTLDVFSKDELFCRLGMEHSNYLWQKEFERLAVYGFRERGPQRDTKWEVRCNAAYSLRTSSEEYTRFLKWFLRGADLAPEWRKQMFTEYVQVPPKAGVPGESRLFRNLGWVTEVSDEFGKIRFHGGNNVAYKGMAIMIPERQVTLCYFFNGDTRYNMHGPLTDLFLKPKKRLYAHLGGLQLPAKK